MEIFEFHFVNFSNDRVNCIRCTNESLIWGWGLEIQNFVVDAVSIYLSHSLSLSCSLCSVVLFRWIFESCVNLSRFRINLKRIYDEENESRVQFVQREPTKIKEGWWCYQWCRFGFFYFFISANLFLISLVVSDSISIKSFEMEQWCVKHSVHREFSVSSDWGEIMKITKNLNSKLKRAGYK